MDNLQLDLVFEQGKPIEFTVEGDNAATVFLSGYYVTGFAQKEKAEDEDDEMEEDSETSSGIKRSRRTLSSVSTKSSVKQRGRRRGRRRG